MMYQKRIRVTSMIRMHVLHEWMHQPWIYRAAQFVVSYFWLTGVESACMHNVWSCPLITAMLLLFLLLYAILC